MKQLKTYLNISTKMETITDKRKDHEILPDFRPSTKEKFLFKVGYIVRLSFLEPN